MKADHEHPRAVASLTFDRGDVSILVEIPESTFRMREQRSNAFALSREQARELAAAITAWLEEPSASAEPPATLRP